MASTTSTSGVSQASSTNSHNERRECPVCYNDVNDACEKIVNDGCTHLVCCECLQKLKRCPMCRRNIDTYKQKFGHKLWYNRCDETDVPKNPTTTENPTTAENTQTAAGNPSTM